MRRHRPALRRAPNGGGGVSATQESTDFNQAGRSIRGNPHGLSACGRRPLIRLGVPVEAIKDLIANRVLRLYDPTITEKSFRDFCRRYGSLINYEFLNRETKDWLQSSMDFVRSSGESMSRRLVPLRKHARIVRECEKCGHKIRGNVFFSHIKRCGRKVSESSQDKSAMRRLV